MDIGINCGVELEQIEDEIAIGERRRGIPRSDVERVAQHYGITLEEAAEWLMIHPVEELLPERGAGLPPIPLAFEKAVAMPALLNPRATIDKVEPLTFKPGDRIDLAVYYTPANDEESMWQTVVNVIKGTAKLVQERQHHFSMKPGQIRADCDTKFTMPSEPVTLTIEVWGHPDYFTTTWPDP